MNDRAKAIAILQQARDILAERLTERILESRDAILEDAFGMSYGGEIDALQEQLGQRLNNVHLLLNNLPPADDPAPPPDEEPMPQPPAIAYDAAEVMPAAAPTSPHFLTTATGTTLPVEQVMLVAPGEAEQASSAAPVSFQAFVERIMANDVEGAGEVLAGLFDVSRERGRQCARRFQEQLAERPQILQKAMSLRAELAGGSVNGSLILLWECFGLQGIESLAALQSLRARLSVGTGT